MSGLRAPLELVFKILSIEEIGGLGSGKRGEGKGDEKGAKRFGEAIEDGLIPKPVFLWAAKRFGRSSDKYVSHDQIGIEGEVGRSQQKLRFNILWLLFSFLSLHFSWLCVRVCVREDLRMR